MRARLHSLKHLTAGLLLASVASIVQAASPVGDAWQRPALMVKAPARQALLSLAQSGERVVAVGERGIVALSDDKGRTWRQVPCPVSVTLTTVRFASARRGVAVGHAGIVLVTQDAGETWTVSLDGRQLAKLAKQAATTQEAHKEADRLLSDGPDKPFLDVLLWDEQHFLAVGAFGIAFHSQDGGRTWAPWMARLPNPGGLHWYVARRAGDAVVLAGEQGLIARSDDGGKTFQPVPSPYKGSWFTGVLRSDGHAVLAGLRGNVWQSPHAGAPWTQLLSPMPASITATATTADGAWLFANQAGWLLASRGDALVPVNSIPLPMPASLLALSDGAVLTAGPAGAQIADMRLEAKP